MIDRWSKTIYSNLVPRKGTREHWYAGVALKRDIEQLGYQKFIIKCDPEHAIVAFIKEARNLFIKAFFPTEHNFSDFALDDAFRTVEAG